MNQYLQRGTFSPNENKRINIRDLDSDDEVNNSAQAADLVKKLIKTPLQA